MHLWKGSKCHGLCVVGDHTSSSRPPRSFIFCKTKAEQDSCEYLLGAAASQSESRSMSKHTEGVESWRVHLLGHYPPNVTLHIWVFWIQAESLHVSKGHSKRKGNRSTCQQKVPRGSYQSDDGISLSNRTSPGSKWGHQWPRANSHDLRLAAVCGGWVDLQPPDSLLLHHGYVADAAAVQGCWGDALYCGTERGKGVWSERCFLCCKLEIHNRLIQS